MVLTGFVLSVGREREGWVGVGCCCQVLFYLLQAGRSWSCHGRRIVSRPKDRLTKLQGQGSHVLTTPLSGFSGTFDSAHMASLLNQASTQPMTREELNKTVSVWFL